MRLAGELEATLELRLPSTIVHLHLDRADVVEGMHEGLGVANLVGQRDRLGTPLERGPRVASEHREAGQGAVRARKLPTGRGLLEHSDCLMRRFEPLLRPPDASEQPCSKANIVAFLDDVALAPVDRDRLINRVNGLAAHIGQVRMVREPLEQLGTRCGGHPTGKAQRRRNEAGPRAVSRAPPPVPRPQARIAVQPGCRPPLRRGGQGAVGQER